MPAEIGCDLPVSSARPPLKALINSLVNRLAANPSFRAWAARFPLTRAISRRQTQSLFDLCAGFTYSKILESFVTAGMLDALKHGPMSLADIARQTGLETSMTDRLVRAAAALGLAQHFGDDTYGLGLNGAALVDNPGVIAMIRHHQDFYRDLEDPLALLKGNSAQTRLNQCWAYLSPDHAETLTSDIASDYSDIMAQSQIMISEIVTSSFDFTKHKRIMDVGGGTGVFLEHVANAAPGAELTLFDLPQVANLAIDRLTEIGLAGRINSVGGDFASGDLPGNQDLITLVRVAYDHPDSRVEPLLRSCYKALSPNGALIIAEPLSGDPHPHKTADAYFGFYLLAMGSGKTRRFSEHRALLTRAGFKHVDLIKTVQPALAGIVIARP